jgi:hypothetical protein
MQYLSILILSMSRHRTTIIKKIIKIVYETFFDTYIGDTYKQKIKKILALNISKNYQIQLY